MGELALEPIFVHHPVGPLTPGSPSFVEHQGLCHANRHSTAKDLFVFPGGFPVAGIRGSIGPQPRRVLAILHAEEVTLFLPTAWPSLQRTSAKHRVGSNSLLRLSLSWSRNASEKKLKARIYLKEQQSA